jgi:hypothetical protein
MTSKIQRRSLGPVELPKQPGGEPNLNRGARHHPNYSLNSIQVNPENPRKPDLQRAGITLDCIKNVRKKPVESQPDFETRVSTWIDKNANLSDEQKDYWHRFLNFSLSILDGGLLQPISIRESQPNIRIATIIAGERRFLAHWLIGETSIAALVTQMDDTRASMLSLVENIQREGISLNAMIQGIRQHKDRFGLAFTMAEVARITNFSKGSSVGIYHAVHADADHPVHNLIDQGQLTKPYHLKKYFDDLNGKVKPESPASKSSPRSNLTAVDSDQNNVESESLTASSQPVRSNLTVEAEEAPNDSLRSNLTVVDDASMNREGETADLHQANTQMDNAEERWEPIRNLLASVCRDVLKMNNYEYQKTTAKIKAVCSADKLDELMAILAKIHEGETE